MGSDFPQGGICWGAVYYPIGVVVNTEDKTHRQYTRKTTTTEHTIPLPHRIVLGIIEKHTSESGQQKPEKVREAYSKHGNNQPLAGHDWLQTHLTMVSGTF